jgi:hypothetical protein
VNNYQKLIPLPEAVRDIIMELEIPCKLCNKCEYDPPENADDINCKTGILDWLNQPTESETNWREWR